MTKEEAIRILEPETSYATLMEMMGGNWDMSQALLLMVKAQRMAFEALRGKQTGGWINFDDMLPCKVGDTVFDIEDGTPYETRVLSFSYFGDGHWACRTVSSYPNLSEFGKRIFLTREEAEAALKKREANNETD